MKLSTFAILLSVAFTKAGVAGNILFVNYNGSDSGLLDALVADGHSVTSVNVDPTNANNYFQNANLDQYCAVIWSAAYAYNKDVTGASTILFNWVSSGGHVLITTPDGIRNDGTLAGLLGGSGGTDSGANLSTIANLSNNLTTGLFDIRGQQPSSVSDMDALCSPLISGTVGLVSAQYTQCSPNHQDPGYAWSLRNLGSGQVAFITSGNFDSRTTNDPDWTASAIPGDGVYNAGLRNFAHAACTAKATAIPTTSPLALSIMSLMLVGGAVVSLRGRLG